MKVESGKIMKLIVLICVSIALHFPLSTLHSLRAQTAVDLDPELGGRFSFSADKKLARGLHLRLEEEVRMDGNFSSFNRFHTTIGITYKPVSYLKLGFGYALINPYSSSDNAFKSARHRLMFDAGGTLRFGDWRLSLKERLQATYRSGDMNLYQSPRTAWTLKSRLKLSYKGLRRMEPYAYAELRNTLNAPVIHAAYNTASDTWVSPTTGLAKNEAGWFLNGFTGCYVNRLRGAVGVEYRLDKRNSFDLCLMLDHVSDKVVKANAEGTKLKSYTRETGFIGWLTATYNYSF